MLCKKCFGAAISQLSAWFISPVSTLGCETVVQSFIVVQGHAWMVIKTCVHCGLRFGANEMVSGWNV